MGELWIISYLTYQLSLNEKNCAILFPHALIKADRFVFADFVQVTNSTYPSTHKGGVMECGPIKALSFPLNNQFRPIQPFST